MDFMLNQHYVEPTLCRTKSKLLLRHKSSYVRIRMNYNAHIYNKPEVDFCYVVNHHKYNNNSNAEYLQK